MRCITYGPLLPSLRNAFCHLTTELSNALTAIATSRYGLPAFNWRTAWSRHFSMLWGVPCGLMSSKIQQSQVSTRLIIKL